MSIQVHQVPGISGIIGAKHLVQKRQVLDSMLQRLSYGGREKAGSYENKELGVLVGWVCPKGYQGASFPIWNQSKSIGLILFGETYDENGGSVTEESGSAESAGRKWQDLIRSYETEGVRCLLELNGWFGGLLIDLRERRTYLFNDRFGVFRIHYHQNSEEFYFSSEAKSILAAVPETRHLDLKSLAEFMSCNCTLQDRSMFSGVSLLPGGAAWCFYTDRRLRKAAYFDPASWENQTPLEGPEYFEKVKQTWIRILPRYFSGERVGLSLTGGVDSRMILAWMPRDPGEVLCYTFAGKYRDSMDIRLAREVARICGQPHETIYVDSDFLSAFSDLAEYCVFLSDGTMDVTGSIDLYVQIVARQIAPVRVTGTNGGEIMRSLVAFKPGNVSADPFTPEFVNLLKAAAVIYSRERSENQLSFTAFKQVPWYMNTKFTVERSQITLRMPYFDNDLVSLVYRAPEAASKSNDLALRLIADGNPALAEIGTDRGLAFQSIPFLVQARHFYQQFTYRLEYAFDYGMPHWLAKVDRLCSPLHLENYILGRHKFHHFRVWYRDELSGYLKDVLLDGRTLKRPYLRGSDIEKMVRDHIAGRMNYTREFHKIITSELIQRQFIEQS